MKAVERLRAMEWTMGNGQCGTCYGADPANDGSESWVFSEFGHERDCVIGNALEELGEKVIWKYHSRRHELLQKRRWRKFRGREGLKSDREYSRKLFKAMAENHSKR